MLRMIGLGNEEESKEVTDDEKESDSDFMENMDKLVYYEDLDEKYKGAGNINLVGKVEGLSKEKREHLKQLDYFEEGEEEESADKKKKGNVFLERQDKERVERERKRTDKHLLPIDHFYDKKSGKELEKLVLPYSTIDLVFNHKNIWANLQNPNPAYISYHMHNEA